jgi:hypothetical protein
MDIMNYMLRKKYDQFRKFDSRLKDMKKMIQWESVMDPIMFRQHEHRKNLHNMKMKGGIF